MRSRPTCQIPTYIIQHIETLSLARSQDNHGATGHRKIRMRSPTVERNNFLFLTWLAFDQTSTWALPVTLPLPASR